MTNDLFEVFRKFKKSGVTKGEIAELLGIHQGTLSKIIKGEFSLTKQNADLINKEYGHIATVSATKGRQEDDNKDLKPTPVPTTDIVENLLTKEELAKQMKELIHTNKNLSEANKNYSEGFNRVTKQNESLMNIINEQWAKFSSSELSKFPSNPPSIGEYNAHQSFREELQPKGKQKDDQEVQKNKDKLKGNEKN